MKRLLLPLMLVMLGSCGTPQGDYCSSYGVQKGDPEYVKCMDYYFQQQALFQADRNVCDAQADLTYPPSLYSQPQSYVVRTGWGPHRHSEMVHVGADYQQHAQVDALRMRIIQPCMESRGWNSGATWQAGRRMMTKPTRTVSQMDPNGGGLPWLK